MRASSRLHSGINLHQQISYQTEWTDWPGAVRRFLHCWHSNIQPPRASLAIIHGLGEHAGRYSNLAAHFANFGFTVYSFDQQGHGRDLAARGVITSYEDLLDEVGYLLELAYRRLPDLPCFLLGHSMGGNLAINYVLRRSLYPRAVIASSPMFRTQKEPKGIMNSVAQIAARIAPNLPISTGIKIEWLTDDVQEQQNVRRDALYHQRVSLLLGKSLIDSGRWAIEHADQLKIPTLITHGMLDRLTMPDGSADFAERAGANCQLKLLDNHQHEAFRDKQGSQVLQIWTTFLETQCIALPRNVSVSAL